MEERGRSGEEEERWRRRGEMEERGRGGEGEGRWRRGGEVAEERGGGGGEGRWRGGGWRTISCHLVSVSRALYRNVGRGCSDPKALRKP